jgi:hypothetical protein
MTKWDYMREDLPLRKNKLDFMGYDIKICGLFYVVYLVGEREAKWETDSYDDAIQWVKSQNK